MFIWSVHRHAISSMKSSWFHISEIFSRDIYPVLSLLDSLLLWVSFAIYPAANEECSYQDVYIHTQLQPILLFFQPTWQHLFINYKLPSFCSWFIATYQSGQYPPETYSVILLFSLYFGTESALKRRKRKRVQFTLS